MLNGENLNIFDRPCNIDMDESCIAYSKIIFHKILSYQDWGSYGPKLLFLPSLVWEKYHLFDSAIHKGKTNQFANHIFLKNENLSLFLAYFRIPWIMALKCSFFTFDFHPMLCHYVCIRWWDRFRSSINLLHLPEYSDQYFMICFRMSSIVVSSSLHPTYSSNVIPSTPIYSTVAFVSKGKEKVIEPPSPSLLALEPLNSLSPGYALFPPCPSPATIL